MSLIDERRVHSSLEKNTLPQVIAEVVDIDLLIPANIPLIISDDILVVVLLEIDLGHTITATLPLKIREK